MILRALRGFQDATQRTARLLAISVLTAAPTVPAHAQTDWTGANSSDWFIPGNWTAGVPTAGTSANIDTESLHPTVVETPGGRALNLSVDGTGMLAIQNGGTVTDFGGFVGNLPGSQGTATVSAGSTWTNASNVVVGGMGMGTLTIQDGGTVNSGGGGSIGLSAGSTGDVTVTGPGSTWNNSPGGGLNVGAFGTGTLTIANGGTVINDTPNTANIGEFAGSRGTVTVTGADSTWSNSLGVNIGRLGTGTLTVADGGIVNGPIMIATNPGSIGTLNIGAGAGSPAGAPGTLNAPSVAFGGVVTGTGTINFNHTSADYVFAPAITGGGTVNVLAGTTILTGANTYFGATNVNAGTLRAGAMNTFSSSAATTVASVGTLDLNGFGQTLNSLTGSVAIYVGIDWRVFGRHEAIRSCGEVNDLIVWFLGKGLPSVDLAHGDLS